MASSTFERFSSLPCELQRMIWRLAIRPSGYTGGLHHFYIRTSVSNDSTASAVNKRIDGLVFLQQGNMTLTRDRFSHATAVPKFDALQKKPPHLTSNWSAYFWDAGLWTACYASRQAMMEHYNYQRLRQVQNIIVRNSRDLSSGIYRDGELRSEYWDIPVMATVPQEGGEWQLTVNTYRDLFCLNPEYWLSIVDWDKIFTNLSFTPNFQHHGPVRFLAIEFNKTWKDKWPRCFYRLLNENSARGFLVRTIYASGYGHASSYIWLIDRKSCPTTREIKKPMIFYDCKKEYVETKYSDMIQDEKSGYNAGNFYHDLNELAALSYSRRPRPVTEADEDLWSLEDFVGILTCRDFNSPRPSQE
ncbi:hypothetical protein AK830_g5730 [Neonectria ditissima]|uniref:2EXR domain-containing protein n=1 Tax=Neonectria ditissima TaxID=78410 RepID=A0A0P7BDW1_9HYPO|nr:hypothetical protein AK830_g5730 [Neonectria ditissima]